MPETSGAALAPPSGPIRTRRRWLPVAIVGLLVLGLIVGVTLYLRNTPVSGVDAGRAMPRGLTTVFGADFHQLLRHDWAKRLLDDPNVAKAVEIAAANSGVDIMALQSIGGGSQIIDEKVHLLIVVNGAFLPDKLDTVLAGMAGEFVEVGGRNMHLVQVPNEAADFEDVIVGLLDSSTLVIGTKPLLERYLAGGDTVADDPKIAPLLDFDGKPLIWGVGVIDMSLRAFVPGLPEAVDGATWTARMGLADALELEVTLRSDVIDDDVAAKLELFMGAGLTLAGFEVKPTITVDGDQIAISLLLPLPNVPGLL